MFLETLISKHSASLTRAIILISEVRSREARPHKWPLKKEPAIPGLEADAPPWHPRMRLFFSDDGGKRKKVVRLSSIQLDKHFEYSL